MIDLPDPYADVLPEELYHRVELTEDPMRLRAVYPRVEFERRGRQFGALIGVFGEMLRDETAPTPEQLEGVITGLDSDEALRWRADRTDVVKCSTGQITTEELESRLSRAAIDWPPA